jgi:hypothetical protein
MARGSRPGERRGGRKKGTPNKVTSAAREAFLATFGKLDVELEGWIRSGADQDPLKAADLVIRMAEYHFPKLGRQEHVGEGGGPVEFVIRDLGKEG